MGAILQEENLKVGPSILGPSPSLLRERSGGGSSFLIACPSARDRFYGEIMAQPLLPRSLWFCVVSPAPTHLPMCRSHSASCWISSTGHSSLCSCKCGVSSRGSECRSLLHCHCEQEPFLFHPCKQIIGQDSARRNNRAPCLDSLKYLLNSCYS